jgi:hypothetical protein
MHCGPTLGPIFGCGSYNEIYILDNSNTTNSNSSSIGNSYTATHLGI